MVQVIKRGKSWLLAVFKGRDIYGKKLLEHKTISAEEYSAKEAKQIGIEFEKEVLASKGKVDRNITFSAFVDYWKKNYAEVPGAYEKLTIQRNEQLLERILPALGRKKLRDIKPEHLLELYEKIRTGERKDGKKIPLSGRTIQMHHRLLSVIFNKAIKWGVIGTNPCSLVDPPKNNPKPITVYDKEMLGKFLSALFSDAPLRFRYGLFLPSPPG